MHGLKKSIVAVLIIIFGFTGCNINNESIEIENGDNVKTQVEDAIEAEVSERIIKDNIHELTIQFLQRL